MYCRALTSGNVVGSSFQLYGQGRLPPGGTVQRDLRDQESAVRKSGRAGQVGKTVSAKALGLNKSGVFKKQDGQGSWI